MRYRRQLIMKSIGNLGQEKIESKTIAIVGCGGLGTTNIYNLSALGVNKLILIDDDIVEESNLNRQYIHNINDIGIKKAFSAKEKVVKLNPKVKVQAICQRLTSKNMVDILFEADIIIDAVDNVETRYLLDEYCTEFNKPVVFAAVENFSGIIYTRLSSEMTPYSNIFPKHEFKEKKEIGVVGAVVSVIGSLQCTEVLKLILETKHINNDVLFIDLLNTNIKKLSIQGAMTHE